MPPDVTLTDYRFGLIIGASAAWGLHAVVTGLEYLTFSGFVIPWNTQNSIVAVLGGVAHIVLAVYLHRWVQSIQAVADAETEVAEQ